MIQDDLVRLKADLFVVDTKGVAGIGNLDTGNLPPTNSMMLSGDAKHGGTCFGDSGGPIFLGTDSNVIGGVTSFGLNGNCAGIGGAFRIDREAELDWINSFSTTP
jgi:secreted trypsin-like serine protease